MLDKKFDEKMKSKRCAGFLSRFVKAVDGFTEATEAP
jgi:hypothetical protein